MELRGFQSHTIRIAKRGGFPAPFYIRKRIKQKRGIPAGLLCGPDIPKGGNQYEKR